MSYLTDLAHRRVTVTQFLGKSVGYLKNKMGLAPTDAEVDTVAAAAEAAAAVTAQGVQDLLTAYIAAHAPMLPASVIATQASTVALHVVDAAISGAANVVKANN